MNIPANSFNSQDNNNQQILNKPLRVFADFNNADEEGHLRLNCIGTIEDLARQKIELQDDQTLTFYSEDLEVDGIVKHSSEENIWVAVKNSERSASRSKPRILFRMASTTPAPRPATRAARPVGLMKS